jgi:hypothetical protein
MIAKWKLCVDPVAQRRTDHIESRKREMDLVKEWIVRARETINGSSLPFTRSFGNVGARGIVMNRNLPHR